MQQQILAGKVGVVFGVANKRSIAWAIAKAWASAGAKLIFNSQTGQWGTDYNSDKDFSRVDLTSKQMSPPVEQFPSHPPPRSSSHEV